MTNRYRAKRQPGLTLGVVLTLLLSLTSLVHGAPPAGDAKAATTGRIDFTVGVLAEDPCSPLNQVDEGTRVFRRGEVVRLVILGRPKVGMNTYPITQRTPDQPETGLSKLSIDAVPGLRPLGPPQESEPEWISVPNVGALLEHRKPFAWQQDLLLLLDATPGVYQLHFTLHLQVCGNTCVWENHVFDVPITVSDAPPVPLSAELQQRLTVKPPAVRVVKAAGIPMESQLRRANSAQVPGVGKAKSVPLPDSAAQYRADIESVQHELQGGDPPPQPSTAGVLRFMLAGVFWGFVSLLTPCVFPMIPITVSFFLKQSEKQHHKPVTMALVYCGTIVVVLTVAAVALLSFFRWLSVHPVMNFGLGALFIFFALSLFGMYEIELPSGLARFTATREGQGGLVGAMFMALTFTIISFACVAPFLGGFGGTAAASGLGLVHRMAGGFAFAATFATPFFVLALFPSLLKKLPKSGAWLNNVKVVMGFLELAAALKFFRAGELVLLSRPVFFTYDLVLGIWIAAAVFCGAYLLNLYRLPHDSPLEAVGVPRMLFGLGFVSLAFYLLPAEFEADRGGKEMKPSGSIYAWVNSFLLPEPQEGKGGLFGGGNLRAAVDAARADRQRTGRPRLVFLDFTGETCTNCKMNEGTVFTRPEVRRLLQNYHRVQMYTDKVPDSFYTAETQSRFAGDTSRQREDAQRNLDFQRNAFGTEQLPFYVILEPEANGTLNVVGHYSEGKINSDAAFVQFLQAPLTPVLP